MNVFAVREACKVAMQHAREHGPIMMEMDTYRYHGHSMCDPGITYRSREEVQGVKKARDPVQTVKDYLLEKAEAQHQRSSSWSRRCAPRLISRSSRRSATRRRRRAG